MMKIDKSNDKITDDRTTIDSFNATLVGEMDHYEEDEGREQDSKADDSYRDKYNISTLEIKESILDCLRDREDSLTEDKIVKNLLDGHKYESCNIDQVIKICLQDLLADPSLIACSVYNSLLYYNVLEYKYNIEIEDKVLDYIKKGYPGCLSFDFLVDSCNTSVWETGYILQRLIDDEKVERMDEREYRYFEGGMNTRVLCTATNTDIKGISPTRLVKLKESIITCLLGKKDKWLKTSQILSYVEAHTGPISCSLDVFDEIISQLVDSLIVSGCIDPSNVKSFKLNMEKYGATKIIDYLRDVDCPKSIEDIVNHVSDYKCNALDQFVRSVIDSDILHSCLVLKNFATNLYRYDPELENDISFVVKGYSPNFVLFDEIVNNFITYSVRDIEYVLQRLVNDGKLISESPFTYKYAVDSKPKADNESNGGLKLIKDNIVDYLIKNQDQWRSIEEMRYQFGKEVGKYCEYNECRETLSSLVEKAIVNCRIGSTGTSSFQFNKSLFDEHTTDVSEAILDYLEDNPGYKAEGGIISFLLNGYNFKSFNCVYLIKYTLYNLLETGKIVLATSPCFSYRKADSNVADSSIVTLDNAIDNVSKTVKQDVEDMVDQEIVKSINNEADKYLGVRGDRELYRVSNYIIDLLNQFLFTKDYLLEYLSSHKIRVEVLGILIKEGLIIEKGDSSKGVCCLQYNKDTEDEVLDAIRELYFSKGITEFTVDDLKQVDDCNNLSGYAIKCYLHVLEDRRGLVIDKGNNKYSMVVESRIKKFKQLAKDCSTEASKYYIDSNKVEDLNKGIANYIGFQQIPETAPLLFNHHCKVCGSETGCMHSREKQEENDN